MIQRLGDRSQSASAIDPASVSATDGIVGQYTARWISKVDQLEDLVEPWNDLVAGALRPNTCFEPNYLIPAFEHLNSDDARVLVVERASKASQTMVPTLCALFPLVQRRIYGFPFRCLEIWKHGQCFDATPLLRSNNAAETLCYAFQYLRQQGVSLVSMDTVSADDPMATVLQQAIRQEATATFDRDRFDRACFRPMADTDTYMKTHVSKGVRKKSRRLQRRLEEQGEFQIIASNADSDFNRLAQQFLELEASGWKRDTGTALQCQPETLRFFESLVKRAGSSGGIKFVSLLIDGKPIAMLCDLYSARHGFAYKTAYDESYASYSPGLLAEIKNIEYLHGYPIEYVDSCTDPGSSTMNRIWGDRIAYQSRVISLRSGPASWAVACMPMMQRLACGVRQWRQLGNMN